MPPDTDGQLCYGIKFEDDTEFPWDDDQYDYDIETWWRTVVCGYKSPYHIWDQNGELLEHVTTEDINRYFAHKSKFDAEHPCPFEVVNYCSESAPMYILALRSSVVEASRGYPEKINPDSLYIGNSDWDALFMFCTKWEIPWADPAWYLSSYWGV